MSLHAWNQQAKRTDKYFNALSDEEMLQPIAAGKNRNIYLLGHLTAVNDAMLPLLGLGERAYPQLDEPFLKNPDQPGTEKIVSTGELRQYWAASNEKLTRAFQGLSPAGWLERHNSISEEDFAKEPHRNKLSVLLNRTSHTAYHLGQLLLFKKV